MLSQRSPSIPDLPFARAPEQRGSLDDVHFDNVAPRDEWTASANLPHRARAMLSGVMWAPLEVGLLLHL